MHQLYFFAIHEHNILHINNGDDSTFTNDSAVDMQWSGTTGSLRWGVPMVISRPSGCSWHHTDYSGVWVSQSYFQAYQTLTTPSYGQAKFSQHEDNRHSAVSQLSSSHNIFKHSSPHTFRQLGAVSKIPWSQWSEIFFTRGGGGRWFHGHYFTFSKKIGFMLVFTIIEWSQK